MSRPKHLAASSSFPLPPLLVVSVLAISLAVVTVTVTAQIRILQPQDLADRYPNGVIRGSTAAFGTPFWGEQLLGELYYPESRGQSYCNATDYDVPAPVSSDDEESQSFPLILVLRRGGCHFVTKVAVAQDDKNAAAVIIVDEEGSTRTPDTIRSIIMADDGRGLAVRIPSILVSDKEGTPIINALKAKRSVVAELGWDVPNDNIVEIDSWLSPSISTSVNFLAQFASFARTLKHKMNFRPHYYIFGLPSDYNSMCLDATGRYCAMTPDWSSNITGRQIVDESVRQLCLWHLTKDLNSSLTHSGYYSEPWWNYVERVAERCYPRDQASQSPAPSPEDSATSTNRQRRLMTAEDTPLDVSRIDSLHQRHQRRQLGPTGEAMEICSYELMDEVDGRSKHSEEVKQCVTEVGHSYLLGELFNHAWSPNAMMINEARFSGPLDAIVVLRAVCTGYSVEPPECKELKMRSTGDDIYIFGDSLTSRRGGVAWWVYFVSVMGSLVICGSMFVIYRCWLVKSLRNELRYEVFEEVKSQMGGLRTPNSNVDNNSSNISNASFGSFTAAGDAGNNYAASNHFAGRNVLPLNVTSG